MVETFQWFATAATIVGALMTAANLGARVTGYGFCVFLAGSIAWLTAGIMSGQSALTWTNAVLTVLNIFGIWRWLGRQAKVEEGARSASEASRSSPGEDLFPVSLLTAAPIRSGESEIGHCVDAMAGCSSGRIDYLIFTDGGVAGVGETLRRVEWTRARMAGGTVTIDRVNPQNLPTVERDNWPGR